MAKTSAADVMRAHLIDTVTLNHSHNRRKSTEYLLKIYPRKDETKYPNTREHGAITKRIGEEYGEDARKLAVSVFTQHSSRIPALLYMHDHWPEDQIPMSASIEKKGEYFGFSSKTLGRFMRNEDFTTKIEIIWKLIIGMRLTPGQSQEFLTLVYNQRSDMDCALAVCLDIWNHAEEYPAHEAINEYLTANFGEDAKAYLYTIDK